MSTQFHFCSPCPHCGGGRHSLSRSSARLQHLSLGQQSSGLQSQGSHSVSVQGSGLPLLTAGNGNLAPKQSWVCLISEERVGTLPKEEASAMLSGGVRNLAVCSGLLIYPFLGFNVQWATNEFRGELWPPQIKIVLINSCLYLHIK